MRAHLSPRLSAILLIVAALPVLVLGGCRRQPAGPVSSSVLPREVHMLDANVGWGLNGPVVLRTADGGATWYDVTPKASGAPILGSDFADADHGIVATALGESSPLTLYSTTDGGKSWSKSATGNGTGGVEVQSTDATHGWVLVHEGMAMGSEAVALLHTKDGGASWTTVTEANPQVSAPGQLPFGGAKSGVSFSDEAHGWLTGYQPVEGHAYLWTTADGGVTWQAGDLEFPRDYAGSELTTLPPVFFSSAEGILPGNFNGQNRATIFYVTHDGGKTWTPGAPLAWPTENGFVWSFPDVKHGFATDGANLFATADGGSSWTEVATDRSLAGTTQLCFVSDQVGWAAGDTSLLKTVDGGKTWTTVQPGK